MRGDKNQVFFDWNWIFFFSFFLLESGKRGVESIRYIWQMKWNLFWWFLFLVDKNEENSNCLLSHTWFFLSIFYTQHTVSFSRENNRTKKKRKKTFDTVFFWRLFWIRLLFPLSSGLEIFGWYFNFTFFFSFLSLFQLSPAEEFFPSFSWSVFEVQKSSFDGCSKFYLLLVWSYANIILACCGLAIQTLIEGRPELLWGVQNTKEKKGKKEVERGWMTLKCVWWADGWNLYKFHASLLRICCRWARFPPIVSQYWDPDFGEGVG